MYSNGAIEVGSGIGAARSGNSNLISCYFGSELDDPVFAALLGFLRVSFCSAMDFFSGFRSILFRDFFVFSFFFWFLGLRDEKRGIADFG